MQGPYKGPHPGKINEIKRRAFFLSFFYKSNWKLAVQPCAPLVGIRPAAQLAASWWNTAAPTWTLLPRYNGGRRGTACLGSQCVSVCVRVESAGEQRGGGRLEPCSGAICLGQKVPLSFTDGWACAPISGGERGAERTRRQRTHLFLPARQINSRCDLCTGWICCTRNLIYTPSSTNHAVKYMWEPGREVTEAGRNTRALLKNDQFWPHRGKIDKLRETGNGRRAKSEDAGKRSWG